MVCVCVGSSVPGLQAAACAVGAQSVVPGLGVRPERVWSKPARYRYVVSPARESVKANLSLAHLLTHLCCKGHQCPVRRGAQTRGFGRRDAKCSEQ